MLWDRPSSGPFLNRGLVSPPFVRQLLTEHDTGRRDNSHWLWSLLMLELWSRELDQSSTLEACRSSLSLKSP